MPGATGVKIVSGTCLAVSSAKTGAIVVVGTGEAISWKPNTWTGVGGVCWVTAEHAHTRSKL